MEPLTAGCMLAVWECCPVLQPLSAAAAVEPPPVPRRLFYLGSAPSWLEGSRLGVMLCCWAWCQAASYSLGESPSRPSWMRRGLYLCG